jgi:Transposase domain (DUF772)
MPPKDERRPRDVIGNAVHAMRIARVQSSRRLEREAGRNVEVMWLTGRVVPDHKAIADFRKDNGRAIRQVCSLHRPGDHLVGVRKHPQGRARPVRCAKRRCLAVVEATPHSGGGRLRTDAYHSHP